MNNLYIHNKMGKNTMLIRSAQIGILDNYGIFFPRVLVHLYGTWWHNHTYVIVESMRWDR